MVSLCQNPIALLNDLSATIIHDLQERCYVREDDNSGDILLYYYFSYTEESLQRADPMLRSYIAQAGFRGSAKALLIEYYKRFNSTFLSEDPSLADLTTFLSELLENLTALEGAMNTSTDGSVPQRQIFVILDALDEIPFGSHRDEVLQFIQDLRNLHRPNLHLLVTSRAGAKETDIADVLENVSSESDIEQGSKVEDGEIESSRSAYTPSDELPLMKYVIAVQNVKKDIELVVRTELRIHPRIRKLRFEVKELILDRLVRKGQPR